MLKINVEHGDIGVAAAVGAIIDKALAEHGFTNVKAKMVMVYQSVKRDPDGGVVPDFSRVSQLAKLTQPKMELRPSGYDTILVDARIALGYPVVFDWMKDDRPDIFASPVLIDIGVEPSNYAEQLKAFKEGTDREAV
jgi:hypothetical protein